MIAKTCLDRLDLLDRPDRLDEIRTPWAISIVSLVSKPKRQYQRPARLKMIPSVGAGCPWIAKRQIVVDSPSPRRQTRPLSSRIGLFSVALDIVCPSTILDPRNFGQCL